MTTILLARHGETDWNRERRWQGHADPPLNPRGREQAEALADELADVHLDAIYASDLRRAAETARTVARRKGMRVHAVRDLREVDVGSWSGLTAAEIEQRFPEGVERWAAGGVGWEGGETHAQMADRVLRALHRIAAHHPAGRVLIVSHGGPIRAIRIHAAGLDFLTDRRSIPVVENCALAEIAIENGALRERRPA